MRRTLLRKVRVISANPPPVPTNREPFYTREFYQPSAPEPGAENEGAPSGTPEEKTP